MKCSICKNEFGIGETCQHCGTDKVVALGNYNGYEAPVSGAYNNSSTASTPQPKIVTVDSMVCHACGEIIPASSKFCPYCSQNLWVECPKCGKTYSSQYPACSECGTNLNEYIKMQQRLAEEEKRRQEEYFERLHRLAEEKRRQREEKRYQLDEKRRKEEIERKKHEEWLNSPEGQAEQKRQKREDYGGYLIFGGCVIGGVGILCGWPYIVFPKFLHQEDFRQPLICLICFIAGLIFFIVGYVFLKENKKS